MKGSDIALETPSKGQGVDRGVCVCVCPGHVTGRTAVGGVTPTWFPGLIP